jgi:hypothetical protein
MECSHEQAGYHSPSEIPDLNHLTESIQGQKVLIIYFFDIDLD